ncbi:hypothetical protein CesoFtcFv8_002883 [Champsocephalus esox]|uniref:Uncharacterized protein n=2 Tax=Champsocephalus TaxID=52236 RepID=A0AAN8E9G7_CHAGU|nr:hypothetical protein CesoFtcFv8_002883 [Champsocephalus esox]KAK5934563.1 hypothetical protein CgunFtcFv8_014953 [Champsocephalus gunnari]
MLRYYTPQDVGKKKHRGQPLTGETLTLCASPGSALFVRRKKRPLVTREHKNHPSQHSNAPPAYGHLPFLC